MKSAIILAALCGALSVSAPVTAEAKGMTDHQIYCSFMPMVKECAKPAEAKPMAPAKTAAAKPVAAPAKVAMAAPAPKPSFLSVPTCVKAAPKAGYMYTCTYK